MSNDSYGFLLYISNRAVYKNSVHQLMKNGNPDLSMVTPKKLLFLHTKMEKILQALKLQNFLLNLYMAV